jgi:hypothetical protein
MKHSSKLGTKNETTSINAKKRERERQKTNALIVRIHKDLHPKSWY